jgi:hypothetical protein
MEAALKQLNELIANEIFRSLDVASLNDIRDLDTMYRVVVALEKAAGITS